MLVVLYLVLLSRLGLGLGLGLSLCLRLSLLLLSKQSGILVRAGGGSNAGSNTTLSTSSRTHSVLTLLHHRPSQMFGGEVSKLLR